MARMWHALGDRSGLLRSGHLPIRRRRAVPKEAVLAIFATAPGIDTGELRADLEDSVSEDLRDPYEGTGL